MSENGTPDVASDLMLADLWTFLQQKAIESKDQRIQDLADTAYGLMDERVIKAIILQRAADSARQSQQNSPIHQLLNRQNR